MSSLIGMIIGSVVPEKNIEGSNDVVFLSERNVLEKKMKLSKVNTYD